MGTRSRSSSPIKTTSTVFCIIETLQSLGEAGITEVADELQLAPSTVHDHLTTLEDEGYVVRHNGRYRLGLRFLSLGMHTKQHQTIAHIVQPVLEEVAKRTGEIAWYMVEETGQGVCADCISANGTRISRSVGNRFELHSNATGMAILSHLPPERQQAIFEERLTSPEIDDPVSDIDALHDELEHIREQGYSTRPDGTSDGLNAIAVPILRSGKVYGSIGVSGPKYRFDGTSREEVVKILEEAKNEIQVRIGREDWVDQHPQIFE